MKNFIAVFLLVILSLAVWGSQADAGTLAWKVAPTLEYEHINFFHAIGFIAYTSEAMYLIDEKTGGVLRELEPTGGFGSRFVYGYYPNTGTFFYNLEYEYHPEKKDTVVKESQNTAIAVHEVDRIVQTGGSDYYEWKDGAKYAIFYNGAFVSDFVYDEVIGGNAIAFVMQNEKFAFADSNGKLITDFIYDGVALIAKGYVAVKKGDTWGFVDASGKEAIPFIFDEALNIDADTAFVKYGGRFGILDVKKTLDSRN